MRNVMQSELYKNTSDQINEQKLTDFRRWILRVQSGVQHTDNQMDIINRRHHEMK